MIATTRFNTKTKLENVNFYNKINNGYIYYGTSIETNPKLSIGSFLIVIEMNNDENEILGTSIILNKPISKYYKIYSNDDFNRYLYKGKYYISRTEILESYPDLVKLLEIILFKGKTHLKRLSGITVLKPKFLNDDKRNILNINISQQLFELYNLKYSIKFQIIKSKSDFEISNLMFNS